MAKKRKTRQQKIILQLKRKLVAQSTKNTPLDSKKEIRQEAISYRSLTLFQKNLHAKKQENIIFSYDPKIIKKNLFKTLFLCLFIFGLQLVLYLKLR